MMFDSDNDDSSGRVLDHVPSTLSEHASKLNEPTSARFTSDRIVWKGGVKPTVIPKNLASDPFISGYVQYYNSRFFGNEVSYADSIRTYKNHFESFLDFIVERNVDSIPDNIFCLLLSHLSKNDKGAVSESAIYSKYTILRQPARRLSGDVRSERKIKNRKLFNELNEQIYFDVRVALQRANEQAPSLRRPHNNGGVDLVERFALDADGELVIRSLRSFSVNYLCAWADIRDHMFEHCFDSLFALRNWYLSRNRPAQMRVPIKGTVAGGGTPMDVLFDIVRSVGHPLLTEKFVVQLLGFFGPRSKPSLFARAAFDFDNLISNVADIDWFEEIENSFRCRKRGRFLGDTTINKTLPRHFAKYDYPHQKYPYVTKDRVGSIGTALSLRELFTVSLEEEVCMAWLLASDRHQASNLQNMQFGDMTITNNSIGTFINPQSYKMRSGKIGGKPYAESSGAQTSGSLYKKSHSVFSALSKYRQQVLRGFNYGFFSELDEFDSVPVLPTLSNLTNGGFNNHFSFQKTRVSSLGILLCAFSGSLSSRFIGETGGNHSEFVNLVRKVYEKEKASATLDASWPVAISYVARQAVNNANGNVASPAMTPLSTSNIAELPDPFIEDSLEIEAGQHNHSLSTKMNVYADKLPAYITGSNSFAARVGDEMVRMTQEIKNQSDVSTVVSLSEARRVLGLSTPVEQESTEFQLNEIMAQAKMNDLVVDELGFIHQPNGHVVILRHPITIALIKAKLAFVDEQIEILMEDNPKRMEKTIIRRLVLAMLLKENFTPREIAEAEQQYGDCDFPMSDILV